MATAGEAIENPVTGERIVFVRTATDTGGELLELEDVWTAPDHTVPRHVHPGMEESWEVVSGSAAIEVDGVEHSLGPGDSVTASAGTPHSGRNTAGGATTLILRFRPALRWEEVVTELFRLAREGRTDDRGTPEPAAMAELLREYSAELAPPPR